jgi:hypothetical protein
VKGSINRRVLPHAAKWLPEALEAQRKDSMACGGLEKRSLAGAIAALCVVLFTWSGVAAGAENGQSQTAGGLTVYLGVVPAEIIKGPPPHSAEPPMHGRIPRGAHEYHFVAAVFDAVTGTRVFNAAVTAQVSGLGLSGTKKKLEDGNRRHNNVGGFFDLPGFDLYTVKLTVERPGGAPPVILEFKYDHRR